MQIFKQTVGGPKLYYLMHEQLKIAYNLSMQVSMGILLERIPINQYTGTPTNTSAQLKKQKETQMQ